MALDRNLVFKAMTRPAMVMGVPLAPLFIAISLCILFGTYTKIYYALVFIPIYLVLRLLTKMDEQIFQLIGLKRFLLPKKMRASKFKKFFKGNFYTYQNHSKSMVNLPKNRKKEIAMLDLDKAITLEEIIPYSSHIEESIIFTKDGNFISTWEIEGISYETRDDADLDRFRNNLASMIRLFEQENVAFYVHNLRLPSDLNFSPEFNNQFAHEITQSYLSSFSNMDFMENHLYFSIVYLPNKGISNRLKSQKERYSEVEYHLKEFQEICEKVEANIKKFGITKLQTYEENNTVFSTQLEFYNFLLTGNHQKVAVLEAPIYSYLGNIDAVFGKDTASIECNGKRTFVKGIEIKDWVQFTTSGFLDNLMKLNCRYVISQSFASSQKTTSRTLIDRKLKQLRSTDDDSVSQQESLVLAKDALSSGHISFGEHHFTLFLYADSLEEINKTSNRVIANLSDLGFLTTFSKIALDEAYFSQLPGNLKFRPRVALISSDNFADLNSLHNNPVGKAFDNCWGNAVTLFKTSNNTPFYFNFHQTRIGRKDLGEAHLGHTLVLGKSGTGKTVLCSFLLTQVMAFENENTFPDYSNNKKFLAVYLDKDHGARANIKALGGIYNELKNGESTGFNPFSLENNSNNIDFLNQLVSILATQDGNRLSTKDKETIDFAVKAVLDLPKESRKYGITRLLENIQDDIDDENSLKSRLRIWQQDGAYGWVFDNESDTLSFDLSSVYGFDGTEILDNKLIVEPLAFYFLHRISMVLDGRRMLLFLDEFWKWIGGDSFKSFIYDGLKTFRKRNGSLIMITQSPSEILNSDVASAIVEQVETSIFLPNSNAKYDEYSVLNISDKEFNHITDLADDSRIFLIKKGNDNEGDGRGNTVLIKLDLSALSKAELSILSSSSDTNELLTRIINEVGEDPKNWVPIFKERLNEI